MEQDNKKEKDLQIREKMGGYSVGNLLSPDLFITAKRNVTLSFCLHDIEVIDGQEIMKISFPRTKNILLRVMKYMNDDDQPVAVFDVVDIDTKKIVISGGNEFIGGLGIEHVLFKANAITQWEIPVFSKLCRSFVLGDVETIKLLITDYYLKFSDKNAVKLKNSLGIK